MVMGFLGSYLDGLPPSRMPPWGVALLVGDAVAPSAAAVVVAALAVAEAMAVRQRERERA